MYFQIGPPYHASTTMSTLDHNFGHLLLVHWDELLSFGEQ
jgi:hypothetical protein